jgi:hypothetical protein
MDDIKLQNPNSSLSFHHRLHTLSQELLYPRLPTLSPLLWARFLPRSMAGWWPAFHARRAHDLPRRGVLLPGQALPGPTAASRSRAACPCPALLPHQAKRLHGWGTICTGDQAPPALARAPSEEVARVRQKCTICTGGRAPPAPGRTGLGLWRQWCVESRCRRSAVARSFGEDLHFLAPFISLSLSQISLKIWRKHLQLLLSTWFRFSWAVHIRELVELAFSAMS